MVRSQESEASGTFQNAEWEVRQAACEEYLANKGSTADLIVADPPYNLGLEYLHYKDNLKPDEFVKQLDVWVNAIYLALKPEGSAYIFMAERYASELDVLCKRRGLHKRSRVVWYYTFGQASSKGWTPSHVSIFYYTKHKKNFVFNKDDPALRVPSARQLVYGDKRANKAGKLPDDTWLLVADQYESLLKYDDDLWNQSRVCGTFKVKDKNTPCQLPSALCQRIIRASSLPGSLVIDPFCGTGQIAVDAARLGRSAATCDVSPYCVDYAIQQLKALKG